MSGSATTRVRALGVLVSVVGVAGVAWWVSRQDAPELPSGAGGWGALAGAVAAYGVATVLRSERWLALLRRDAADPQRTDCYALTTVGFMGNTVLPARMGDALRVVLLRPRAATGARTVIGTLVAERVLDVAVLFSLFGVLAFVVDHDEGSLPSATWIVAGSLAIAGVAGLLMIGRAAAHGSGRIGRVASFLEPMLAATRGLRGGWGAGMAGATLVLWVVEASVWLLSAAAVGIELTPEEALYLLALTSTFALIPSGPGYAGTMDAAVLVGAASIGITGATAVSFLLMLRFVLFVPITVVGLIVLVVRYGGRRGLVAARTQAEAA